MVCPKRWMFDNAPAVIGEYKKLARQQGALGDYLVALLKILQFGNAFCSSVIRAS